MNLAPGNTTSTDLYLELLAGTLTRAVLEDNDEIMGLVSGAVGDRSWRQRVGELVAPFISRVGYQIVRQRPYDSPRSALRSTATGSGSQT